MLLVPVIDLSSSYAPEIRCHVVELDLYFYALVIITDMDYNVNVLNETSWVYTSNFLETVLLPYLLLENYKLCSG